MPVKIGRETFAMAFRYHLPISEMTYTVLSLETACIDLRQTGFVSDGSDHLQLIKIWPYRAPWEGDLLWGEIFGLRLASASAQCLRLSK